MKPSLELGPLIRLVEGQQADGGPLDHLSNAVVVSDDLADLADDLIGHFVDKAREGGASWAEIGDRLGVSKQAAQKRFVDTRASKKGRRRGLFAHFNQDARTLTIRAQTLARDRGSERIGSDHILLAMIADEASVASRAIMANGPSLEELRQATESELGPPGSPTRGHMPFAPDSKKLLGLALRESVRLGDRHIAGEHILLGMLRDEGSAAASALTRLGVERRGVETFIADSAD
ncbi:MAG: Clp protease N-terminal domain-containing protein [Acidimicrobiia bacterium]